MARRHEALIPLSHDHQQALMLAFRLSHPAPPGPVTPTTPASTPQERRLATLAFFEESLDEHFAIEEEVLFPALRRACDAGSAQGQLLDQLCEDHREMRRMRERLERGGAADVAGLLSAFAELLERHVRCEERELFAGFPGSLDAGTVAALEEAIRERHGAAACRRG